jgi:hypothetical protein
MAQVQPPAAAVHAGLSMAGLHRVSLSLVHHRCCTLPEAAPSAAGCYLGGPPSVRHPHHRRATGAHPEELSATPAAQPKRPSLSGLLSRNQLMQDRRTLLLGQKEAQERAKQLKRASNKAPHTCPAIPRHYVGRCVVLASTLSGLWLIDGGPSEWQHREASSPTCRLRDVRLAPPVLACLPSPALPCSVARQPLALTGSCVAVSTHQDEGGVRRGAAPDLLQEHLPGRRGHQAARLRLLPPRPGSPAEGPAVQVGHHQDGRTPGTGVGQNAGQALHTKPGRPSNQAVRGRYGDSHM